MAIIGVNDTTGMSASFYSNINRARRFETAYVPTQDEEIDAFYIFGRVDTDADVGVVVTRSDTGAFVGSIQTITVVGTGSSTQGVWYGVTGLSIPLSAGVGYKIAIDPINSWVAYRRASAGAMSESTQTSLVDPYTVSSAYDFEMAFYATTVSAPPEVSTTDTARPGQAITVSTGNFSSGFDTATFTDSSGNTIGLVVNSATQVTFPALADGISYAAFGVGTITVSNSGNAESASTAVTFAQPTGWQLVTLEAGFGTTEEYFTFYAATPAEEQQYFAATTNNYTLFPDGGVSADADGTYETWVVDPVDGAIEFFNVIIGEGGEPEPPSDPIGLTRRNITRRAFTRRAQTSRGMTQ